MTQRIRKQSYFSHRLKFGSSWKTVSSCLLGFTLLAPPGFAQVIPDQTLGRERSQVKTIDAINQRIEGGATQGSNLFHSFLDFNVDEGRGVYFANPNGIDSILSRVTGNNPSHILGRLGVLGKADLYLLNPNGIVFGPNASLDIQGSFYGSTANHIALGEAGVFSAVAPQQSQLLSVQPQSDFLSQAAHHQGSIINQAQLTTGQDLSLTAGELDLTGQLRAGANLTLQATDNIKIRDSQTSPFIAAAGIHLLIQGNQTVDIFALNHPESGLFSGGDMVLRSTQPILGDAHFNSIGNYQIENLYGELGDFLSLDDPVIQSLGDVTFNSYSGTSLHILAGGKVQIPGFIQITGPDISNGVVETVTLSDGSSLNINGLSEATLDIRAGVKPEFITSSSFNPNNFFPFDFNNLLLNPNLGDPPSLSLSASGADINIGSIIFLPTSGKILLTNQYQPNTSLSGDIKSSATLGSAISTNGGQIFIDSRRDIQISGIVSTTSSSFFGNGGNISFFANRDIIFQPDTLIDSSGFLSGAITLKSRDNILLTRSRLVSESFADKSGLKGGSINIFSKNLSLIDNNTIFSRTQGQADAGDVKINVDKLIAQDGSFISTSAFPNTTGRGGNLEVNSKYIELVGSTQFIDPQGPITTQASGLRSQTAGLGNGGNLTINTEELIVRDGAGISTQTLGEGKGGKLDINATKSITLSGVSLGQGPTLPSGLFTITSGFLTDNFAGRGGDLSIVTGKLIVNDGAKIEGSTTAEGSAGNILIFAKELTELDGLDSGIFAESSNEFLPQQQEAGNAGRISIKTGQLKLDNGSKISSATSTSSNSGKINLVVGKSLLIMNGSQILSNSIGIGSAGDVDISVKDNISLDGVGMQGPSGIFTFIDFVPIVDFQSNRLGGNISINSKSLSLTNGAQLNTLTNGIGSAGNVKINVEDFVNLSNSGSIFSTAEFSAIGRGGSVNIKAKTLNLDNNAQIATNTLSPFPTITNSFDILPSQAGDITIFTDESISLNSNSGILSSVEAGGIGNSGNINIYTSQLNVFNGSQIQAALLREQNGVPGGQGRGGAININASDSVTLSGIGSTGFSSGLLVLSERGAFGPAGDIEVTTGDFQVSNGAIVAAGIFNDGGQGGDITINAQNFKALDGGQILTNTRSSRDAGSIKLNVADSLLIEGSDVNFSSRLNLVRQQLQLSNSSDRLDDVVINEGPNSGLFANTGSNSTGNGGNITIDPTIVILRNGATISVNSQGFGRGGDINVIVNGLFSATDSTITTSADRSSGGAISIQAKDIRLFGDSDITTQVGSGVGTGGDIVLTADSIIAFDDSDILAFAQDGRGGDITLNTPAFFGENFFGVVLSGVDPDTLDGNNRVDLNATGQTSGIITVPDVSFIQNNLTELPENLVNPENLLANSCIVRTADQEQGKFIVTGPGGLPKRPGDAPLSSFPTGTVQTPNNSPTSPQSNSDISWQSGEPIVEPQGVYQLENGQLVMSRECSDL